MITAQHYSPMHWHKQREYIDKYLSEIYRQKIYTPFNEVEKWDRFEELQVSAGELLKRAHVNFFTMVNDKLLINDTAYDTMLDDLRKDLHLRINDAFENEFIKADRAFRQSELVRELVDNLRDKKSIIEVFSGLGKSFEKIMNFQKQGRVDRSSPNYKRGVAMMNEVGPELLKDSGEFRVAHSFGSITKLPAGSPVGNYAKAVQEAEQKVAREREKMERHEEYLLSLLPHNYFRYYVLRNSSGEKWAIKKSEFHKREHLPPDQHFKVVTLNGEQWTRIR